ncbi:uncharacterized protein [Ptychodera flava]|uniref:uncharacterized protein n=1 Tax=Ptychodera flava TaxID=63121 RepID=UPI003969E624
MLSVTVALCLLALSCSEAALKTRQLGVFPIERPGFTSVFKYDAPDKYDLFITTFQAVPGTRDEVHMITDIGSKLDRLATVSSDIISRTVLWPNEIEEIPDDVSGEEGHLWIASGFLVAGKDDGAISAINPKMDGNRATPTTISIDLDGNPWFYHRVEWVDMNNDGLKDALTARARVVSSGIGGSTYDADLVWFENSGSLDSAPWVPHVVVNGPDCFFRKIELTLPDKTVKHCVISAQYFSEQLTIAWTDDPKGSWTDPTQTHFRVIDEGLGHYFDLEVVDLNMDGKLDLLVSVNRNFNGTMMAYEIPDDFINDEWPRHLLADGFDGGFGEGRGAPGSGFTFRPASEPDRNKPLMLLSGDDDGTVYLIQSYDDADVNNWSYFKTALWTVSGTLGAISAVDVDGDGYEELFLPAWSKGELQVLTFAP